MAVVGGVLGRAGQAGQARRLAEAAKGKSTWENPPDITRHMEQAAKEARRQQKAVMGRMQHKIEGFNEEEQNILRSQFYGEELEVSEADMVQMMGEAAAEEAVVETASAASSSSEGAHLSGIEEQLAALKEVATSIEAEIKGTGSQKQD